MDVILDCKDEVPRFESHLSKFSFWSKKAILLNTFLLLMSIKYYFILDYIIIALFILFFIFYSS